MLQYVSMLRLQIIFMVHSTLVWVQCNSQRNVAATDKVPRNQVAMKESERTVLETMPIENEVFKIRCDSTLHCKFSSEYISCFIYFYCISSFFFRLWKPTLHQKIVTGSM